MALLGAGCGSSEHPNEPRPQPPTRISVAISEDAVTVQPPRIAIGPEPTQQIPQNQHAGQPRVRSDAPLNVVFVAANLTDVDSHLQVRGNGKDLTSQPLYANAGVTLQVDPAHRRLPGQRRRHPRRQTGKAGRRPVPHVLRERPAAALSR